MGWDRVGDVWRWILLGVDGAAAAATTACESERGTERAGERKRTSPWAAGRLRSTGAEAALCRQSRVTESQARPGQARGGWRDATTPSSPGHRQASERVEARRVQLGREEKRREIRCVVLTGRYLTVLGWQCQAQNQLSARAAGLS